MKRNKPTKEQLSQFWNHKINPITGWFKNKSDDYSASHRRQLEIARKTNKESNKE